MDANRLFTMLLHQVVRRLLGRGIDAGIDRMTRGRGDGGTAHPGDRPPARTGGGKAARQTRQAMRLARRMGRF